MRILFLVLLGSFAFITFILAQHKDEIWETIIFEEGDNNGKHPEEHK